MKKSNNLESNQSSENILNVSVIFGILNDRYIYFVYLFSVLRAYGYKGDVSSKI